MVDVELSCGMRPGSDFADLPVLTEELGYARADVRTTRIMLATPVRTPSQRSVMTMAAGIATIARPGPAEARTMKIVDATSIRNHFAQLGNSGFREIVYTPSGSDIACELQAFTAAQHAR
jgi:hypothetical protein